MATKITKRARFEALLSMPSVQADAGMVEFINHELELLAKKNSGEHKPTATQLANVGIKADIVDVLTTNGGLMTVSDIQKSLTSELSNQRVSALLRQLIADGAVVRVEDKRKAFFKIA